MATANAIVEAEFTLLKRQLNGQTVRGPRRYRCDLATLCRIIASPSQATDTAWVHDVSTSGIGLLYTRELAPASALTLRLRKNDQSGVISIGATVVHASPEVNGAWRIGCRLERQLTDDEIDSCL